MKLKVSKAGVPLTDKSMVTKDIYMGWRCRLGSKPSAGKGFILVLNVGNYTRPTWEQADLVCGSFPVQYYSITVLGLKFPKIAGQISSIFKKLVRAKESMPAFNGTDFI